MKIIKILSGNDDGGVFTCERQYIEILKANNIFVFGIILGKGNSYDEYKEIVDEYIEIPANDAYFGGNLRNRLKNINLAYKYGKSQLEKVLPKLREYKFEAVFYRRVPFLFFGGLIGKKLNTPTYWHMPTAVNDTYSYLFYNLFLRIFKVQPIANSEYTKQTMGGLCKYVLYPGYNPQRIVNGIEKYRTQLKISEKASVFGIVGRIDRQKAQDIVIKAFVESDAIKEGNHLIIAGGYIDENYFEQVKSAAGKYFGTQVHYIGKISDINNFFASIDVMINGRINAEPFGISIAESLGAGIPVIAYNLGGPTEMVIPHKTGWLIDKSDAEHYKKAINTALADRNNWSAMSDMCKQHSRKFTVSENVEKLIQIINTEK